MTQNLLVEDISIEDQNQNVLNSGRYMAIQIYFTPLGSTEVKIDPKGPGNFKLTKNQIFQIAFLGQGIIDIRGAKHGQSDAEFIKEYSGNTNTIKIEDSSGSNSIEKIYVFRPDGTGWNQLTLENNPSKVVISIKSRPDPGGPTNGQPTKPPAGKLLWSSTAWSNGKERKLTGHEEEDPEDSTKVMVSAGDDFRKLVIDGKGTAFLSGARSRIYIEVKNYNAMMQLTYTHLNNLDNLSMKLRSQRNEKEGFSGYGFIIYRDEVEGKYQPKYGENDVEIGKKKLSKKVPDDSPITIKWCVRDEGDKIQVKGWIDYGNNGEFEEVFAEFDDKPPRIARDKDKFLKSATAWIRVNNKEETPKDIPIKDVSIIEIE